MATNMTRIPDGTIRLTQPGSDRIYLGLYVEDDSVQGQVFVGGDLLMGAWPLGMIEQEIRRGDTEGDFEDDEAPGATETIHWHWEFAHKV
jgi:hypothetical protein